MDSNIKISVTIFWIKICITVLGSFYRNRFFSLEIIFTSKKIARYVWDCQICLFRCIRRFGLWHFPSIKKIWYFWSECYFWQFWRATGPKFFRSKEMYPWDRDPKLFSIPSISNGPPIIPTKQCAHQGKHWNRPSSNSDLS